MKARKLNKRGGYTYYQYLPINLGLYRLLNNRIETIQYRCLRGKRRGIGWRKACSSWFGLTKVTLEEAKQFAPHFFV